MHFNPIVLRKTKIVYNFGPSDFSRIDTENCPFMADHLLGQKPRTMRPAAVNTITWSNTYLDRIHNVPDNNDETSCCKYHYTPQADNNQSSLSNLRIYQLKIKYTKRNAKSEVCTKCHSLLKSHSISKLSNAFSPIYFLLFTAYRFDDLCLSKSMRIN